MALKQEALEYHSRRPPGKWEITPTKPCLTQRDLSLAYTPGVAEPCLEIQKNPDDAYKYTNKGNLVAVITNGTAVLGLGNISALAGKPVMEGKALLFKRFADIDSIDIELNTEDPELIIQTVKLLEPTFGGVNLEDIKAPECFYIEERLKKQMQIPVFHDDQHGTAIISGAALLNALELVNKKIDQIKIVFNGAGASAIATAEFYIELGAQRENIIICDTKGVVYQGRTAGMNPYKERFAVKTKARTLAEALKDADLFVGLSAAVGGLVTPAMVKAMAKKPLIFAMANPLPEILPHEARAARPDAIVATGRSDFPNQINNVLGFPFIFRGALDVRATQINEAMKIAAAQSLAALAKEDVPDAVAKAYGLESLHFGPDYLIPKPLDPRVLLWEAPAIAQAAMETGTARIKLDLNKYREQLEARLGRSRELMRIVFNKAKSKPKRIVLAGSEHDKMIRAAHQIVEEGIAKPILIGDAQKIRRKAEGLQISLTNMEVVDPQSDPRRERYAQRLYELRCRKGVARSEVQELITKPNYFATVMVELGDADGMIAALGFHYPEGLRPILEIIKTCPDCKTIAGVYLVTTKDRVLLFADATVNVETDAEKLAEIAILTARLARNFDLEPRIAMLSYSDFGSVRHPRTERVRQAVELVRKRDPNLVIDGEMQADTALLSEILNGGYPFNRLQEPANILIFPNLESGNIGYKLVQCLGKAEVIGPILTGTRRPAHVLQRYHEVKEIVNLAAIAVVEAQNLEASAQTDGCCSEAKR